MFEQKRFCGDGPYATWAQMRRKRNQQMNSEHEQFAHGANGTIVVSACKTARRGQIASHYEFATHGLDLVFACSALLFREQVLLSGLETDPPKHDVAVTE